MATAIYGPVTLAYVAEQARRGRAERLAWFGTARNPGYIVGPAAAGWMLLTMEPVTVFTVPKGPRYSAGERYFGSHDS